MVTREIDETDWARVVARDRETAHQLQDLVATRNAETNLEKRIELDERIFELQGRTSQQSPHVVRSCSSMPSITKDGIAFAHAWLVESMNDAVRGKKVIVYLYQLHGLAIFVGCASLEDVLATYGIAESSFHKWSALLREKGMNLSGPLK